MPHRTARSAQNILFPALLLLTDALHAANLIPFDQGKTPANQIHVASGGSNTTGDGSVGKPYASIGRAMNDASPGSAVVLAPGTYAGGTYLSDIAGTSNAPIWIRGSDPTNRAVLDGSGEGLHLTRVKYLVVENLEVRNSTSNGINCDDGGDYANSNAARYVVFRNLYIHDIGGTGNQDGLKLSGLNDYWVLNSEFARCGGASSGSGIDHVGCHFGVIAGCYFQEMSGNAVQCKGGSSDIDILQCRIVNGGARGINIGGSTGFEYFRPPLSTTATNYEARAVRVTANIFKGSTTPLAYVGCIDCMVANNTIIDPDNWHLRILQETVSSPPYYFYPAGRSSFLNNLVYFERAGMSSTDINVGVNTEPATFTFANNLWYAYDNPSDSAPDYPVAEQNGIAGQDPKLTDPTNSLYTITLQSPAALHGTNVPAVLHDFSGERYLSPPGIGAYEISGNTDGDNLPDLWEMRYFNSIATSGGGAGEDYDDDKFSDYKEYVAGTLPTNPASALRISGLWPTASGQECILAWQSISNRLYLIQKCTNTAPNAFTNEIRGLSATPPQNLHTVSVDSSVCFYRVGIDR